MKYQLGQITKSFCENHDKGKLVSHDLYRGIQLSFISLESDDFSFQHPILDHILAINYCHSGRIEWQMGNGNSVYLSPGDFSLHTMDSCANSLFSLPTGDYQGLILFIDLRELSQNPPKLLSETEITGEFLYQKFCKDGAFTSLAGNEQTEAIFATFFNLPENLQLPYWKLKTLELLLYLFRLEADTRSYLTEYQYEQIKIIRSIHDQLVENLDQRITIDSLSREYLINPTTLKKVFKAVYGISIAAHIKIHRMEQAAKMLRETRDDILQIAQNVGYESQSRFTAAFKEHFHMLPTEYRKKFQIPGNYQ